ncbi:MAG: hypothetical protein AAGF31_01405 [Planctomycetota bacterium]
MTNATTRSTARTDKPEQAQLAFAELLSQASRRGFYGTASLTLSVQDGHVQHLKIATERMIR